MGTVSCSPNKRYTPDSGINMSSMTGSETLSPDIQILSGSYQGFQETRPPVIVNEGAQTNSNQSLTHSEVSSNVFTFSNIKTTNSPMTYTDTMMSDTLGITCGIPKGTVPLSHAPSVIQDMGVGSMTTSVRSHFGGSSYPEPPAASMSGLGNGSSSGFHHRQYYGGYDQYHSPPVAANHTYCQPPYAQKPLPYLSHPSQTATSSSTLGRPQVYHQRPPVPASLPDCISYPGPAPLHPAVSTTQPATPSMYGSFPTTGASSATRNIPPLLSVHPTTTSIGKIVEHTSSSPNPRSSAAASSGGLPWQQKEDRLNVEAREEKGEGGAETDRKDKLLSKR